MATFSVSANVGVSGVSKSRFIRMTIPDEWTDEQLYMFLKENGIEDDWVDRYEAEWRQLMQHNLSLHGEAIDKGETKDEEASKG